MRQFTRVPRSDDDTSRAPDREADCHARYGGALLPAASALPLNGALSRPRGLARLTAAAVRRPRRIVALIALLLRVPREYVVMSRSSAGQALDRYFNQRLLAILPQNRLCRGVLLLPQDHSDYLRGRRRQALRTNLHRAAAAGIECEVVSDVQSAVNDISHVLRRHWDWLSEAELDARLDDARAAVVRGEVTITVARDPQGRPLAVAATVIDDAVCLILGAVATCHEARWALHDHLVRILIARRVRYLLAEGGGPFGALGFSRNVQHYQHLLGYELCHMIPIRAHRAGRRWRLVAGAAVAAAATAAILVPPAVASTLVRPSVAPATWTPSHQMSRLFWARPQPLCVATGRPVPAAPSKLAAKPS
jgi:hypothetical protein